MSTYNIGRIIPIFKGEYDSTASYEKLDIVYYNGSSYVAKGTTTGNAPTNTTYWLIVALKGELSPTLSEDQVASIIALIESETGWVNDTNYVHTDNNFSETYVNKVDGIGDATITIAKNGTTISSFSTNTSTNKTIDIEVPTAISQLSGTEEFLKEPDMDITSDTTLVIDLLQYNHVYYVDESVSLTSLTINAYEWSSHKDSYVNRASYIEFTAGDNMTFNIPTTIRYVETTPVFEASVRYRLTFYGNTLKTERLI